jgi:hypothetical protein
MILHSLLVKIVVIACYFLIPFFLGIYRLRVKNSSKRDFRIEADDQIHSLQTVLQVWDGSGF